MIRQMVVGNIDDIITDMRVTIRYFARGTPLRLSGVDDAIAEFLGYADFNKLEDAIDPEKKTLPISLKPHRLRSKEGLGGIWNGLLYLGTDHDSDSVITEVLYKRLMSIVIAARKDHEIQFGSVQLDDLIMDEQSRSILNKIASERRHVLVFGGDTSEALLAIEAMVMAGSKAERYVILEVDPIVALPSSYKTLTPDVRQAKPLDPKILQPSDYLIDRNIRLHHIQHFYSSSMVERSLMWPMFECSEQPFNVIRNLKGKQSVMFPKSNREPVGIDTLVLFSKEQGRLIDGAWDIDKNWNMSEIR
ncbi:hypothetical protein [Mesorhizobium sp. SP-1A]|uniref:hypothetical protein n=1 Tax=Mesorhizobium sp. SP-1A TaxID=3077840 RepID=UPI0028F74D78|nr:hypothetical protein [Mesorhizobium sp. SP-1A]